MLVGSTCIGFASSLIDDYELMPTKTQIKDSDFAYSLSDGGTKVITNDETVQPGVNAAIFKIPLPKESNGLKVDKFIFRFVSKFDSGSSFKLMKMPGDDWDLSSLKYGDEAISNIISGGSEYIANEGDILTADVGIFDSIFNYADISSYASECMNDGQKYVYVLLTSASTAKVFGTITDTDFISYDMYPYCYYTYGEADPLEFVSSEPANRTENAYSEYASFTFNNGIASAEAVVNGESAECICDGRTATVDFYLEEYEDYEITITATDIYGQSISNTIRFSTSGGAGAVTSKEGGFSYAVKASGTAESNRNSIDVDTSNFMLYQIPLPSLSGTQSLGSFTFNYTALGRSEDSTLLKFHGDEWDVSSMTFADEDVSEIISAYIADGNNTSFNAASSKNSEKLSNTIHRVSADVTAYAEECIQKGQSFMWLASVTTSTMNCYGFGYSDDYDPSWTYATMNPMYKAMDAKVLIEENSLSELSFKLLTSDEDINDSIVLKNVTSGENVEVTFEYDSEKGIYVAVENVSLEAGASYELVILSGSEDDYGNVLSSDITVTKFTNVSFEEIPEKTDDNADMMVSVDTEKEVIGVYYKNPAYANRRVKIIVENPEYDETVYEEEFVSNSRGTLNAEGIEMSESGIYVVTVYPEYSDSVAKTLVRYYTTDDALLLWEIAAVSGSAEEISDNWNELSNFLGLKEDNLEYVSDVEAFYGKLANERPDGIEEYNEDNKKAYVSFADTMALFTALEQCKDIDSLKNLAGKALLKVGTYDTELAALWSSCTQSAYYDEVIEAFADSDMEINSVEDLSARMSEAAEIYQAVYYLELIANVEHGSEITEIISDEEVADILGISDYMDDFAKLKSKTSVEKALTKDFDDAESFAKAFKTAVKKALDAQNEKKKPSTSGGSTSGNYGGATNFTAAGDNKASEYASGQNTQTACPFTDLSGYDWAKTHIEALYSLGVINGKTKTEYSPADTVTREEFVKLIVTLMKLEAKSSNTAFDDAVPGSWYESYVNTAVANGIAGGMGDNLFGVGKNASRQDIAVMIVNALKNKGIEITPGELTFGDSESVADYAKDSVAFLASKGVLTGDTEGFFNPASNATRAEVAVMLSRVSEMFLKEVR